MVILGIFVFAKAFYIQTAEGSYWKSLSDSLHLEYREMDAERGSIYSEDGRMLSSSIPNFDIYLDFGAEGIQQKNGAIFKKQVAKKFAMYWAQIILLLSLHRKGTMSA